MVAWLHTLHMRGVDDHKGDTGYNHHLPEIMLSKYFSPVCMFVFVWELEFFSFRFSPWQLSGPVYVSIDRVLAVSSSYYHL
jgi:hypothetical protein